MSRSIRMRCGVDVWECSRCGSIVVMGRACRCGQTYADELKQGGSQRVSAETMTERTLKRMKKPDVPLKVSSSTLIESFFYRKK